MGTNMSLGISVATIAAFFALVPVPAHASAMRCSGPDPAVMSVVVAKMTSDGKLNRYTLSAKVVNVGRVSQSSDTLQFVDIYQGKTKLDSRSIPPLRAGQAFTVSYDSMRSAQAGSETTALSFKMNVRRPSLPGQQACNTGNGSAMVRF